MIKRSSPHAVAHKSHQKVARRNSKSPIPVQTGLPRQNSMSGAIREAITKANQLNNSRPASQKKV